MAAEVWDFFAEQGVDRRDPGTWVEGRAKRLQKLTKRQPYRAVEAAALAVAPSILAGEGLVLTKPQPLITFPDAERWTIPHSIWHFDLPARRVSDEPIALRLIGIVEDVAPGGGATVVVEGSHHFVDRYVTEAGGDFGSSKDVRKRLRREHEWFADLNREGDRPHLLEPTDVDGVTVRVTELTGDAGDAWLMHPWLLHGLAPNASDRVRHMMTHTIYGPGWKVLSSRPS